MGMGKAMAGEELGKIGLTLGGGRGYILGCVSMSSVKTTLDEYGTEDLEDVQENYNKIMMDHSCL